MRRGENEGFEARWRARFESYGRSYGSEAYIAGWSPNGLRTRVEAFDGAVGAVKGRWLDAGCGAGTYVRGLRARGASEVVGLDYSQPSVIKARDFVPDPAVAWVVGDVRYLPFPDASFEGVLSFGVTQTLSDSAELVRELVRVTRPGGQVWVDALNSSCVWHVAKRLRDRVRGSRQHLRTERAAALSKALRDAGCSRVSVRPVLILPERYRDWQSRLTRLGVERLPFFGSALSHAVLVGAVKPDV